MEEATAVRDMLFVTADDYLLDSFRLAKKIRDSGYRPNYMVGVWRGGTPPGIAVHEYLDYYGIKTDHVPIKTEGYVGIEKIGREIKVYGLEYLVNHCNADDSLLIVEDIFDKGLSINAIIQELIKRCRRNMPETKLASVYFKPKSNQTSRIPDFYIHETSKWVVFPHELKGLTKEEIRLKGKEIADIVLAD